MAKKSAYMNNENDTSFIGENLGFEGKEAFNLLRTNILFAVKRKDRSERVIGVTS